MGSLHEFPKIPDGFVPGRISQLQHLRFWEDVLKPREEILSIIRDGYRIQDTFINGVLPLPSMEPNNMSTLKESSFLLQELFPWEKIGCTSRHEMKPRIILPFSVVYSNKWRAVVDASRDINPFVVKNLVALEPLSSIGSLVKKARR